MSTSARRLAGMLRWGLRLWLLAMLWLTGVAFYIIWIGDRDQAMPADVIIVLGAAAYDAKPSPVFEQRIRHGINLFERGLAERLIFTGGHGGSAARFAESEVARRFARRQGVPKEAILIETVSRTTEQNLEQAAALMRELDYGCAIIVSDPLHLARALRLARRYGIDPLGSATPTTRFKGLESRAKFLFQEVGFFHYDLWTALMESPPESARDASSRSACAQAHHPARL